MLLEKYKECLEKDKWPGYMDESAGINSLSVPAWIKDSLSVEESGEGEFE